MPLIKDKDQRAIVAILLGQALVGLAVAGAAALWFGQTAAVSALLGGAIAVVPNAFLAARLLTARSGATAEAGAKALLGAAWVGEIGKLFATIGLFAAVFIAVRPLSVPAVFAGYIAAQLVIFGAPLFGSGLLDGKDGKAK
ncbi:MAG: ATP synthase subunit I [Gammaproteobacteria bacterium]|nr:ATP synthase subunit I [Gammaproteobacteria bacterium]